MQKFRFDLVFHMWITISLYLLKNLLITFTKMIFLTLSLRKPTSYRNESIDLLCKSMDWFLYDIGLRGERVKIWPTIFFLKIDNVRLCKYSRPWRKLLCKPKDWVLQKIKTKPFMRLTAVTAKQSPLVNLNSF